MEFSASYTTAGKITADKDGIEIKKTTLSEDAHAIGTMIESLIFKIEHLRLTLNT